MWILLKANCRISLFNGERKESILFQLQMLRTANICLRRGVLRPVDSTILFFQRDLVIVMILGEIEWGSFDYNSQTFSSGGFIRFFSRTHKSRL